MITFIVALGFIVLVITFATSAAPSTSTRVDGVGESIEHAVSPLTGLRRTLQSIKRKEKELDDREVQIEHKERELGLSFKQLSLERQGIANKMEKLALDKEKTLFAIKGAMQSVLDKIKSFEYSKKDFALFIRGKELDDYNRSLKHLEKTIVSSHKQRVFDLHQQKKELNLQLREKEHFLDKIFSTQMDKVREMGLQFKQRDIEQARRDLSQDKTGLQQEAKSHYIQLISKELEHKKQVIQTYEAVRYEDEAFRRRYDSFGLTLNNPLIDENQRLKQEIQSMHHQKQ